MEINLSLPELDAILDASRKQEFNRNKFAAALKGVDLDDSEESDEDRFNAIEARAKARAAGISEDEYEFAELGLGVEREGDNA